MLNNRRIALLGVLAAVNSIVRLMGVGIAGMETAFALIIISGFVFGARFGAMLGTISILASALISGGVGPWLPFQLLAAAIVGFGAGFIPRRFYLIGMSVYAVISSYVYGALMTFWTWPLFTGSNTSLSVVENGSLVENLWRFVQFEFVTGGLLWDTGRAITTTTLILLIGKALVTILERAATRADFAKA